jgi:hypothetical protein
MKFNSQTEETFMSPLRKIVLFLLLAAVGTAIQSFAQAPNSPPAQPDKPSLRANKTSPIEISRIDPSSGDLHRIDQKHKKGGAAAAAAGLDEDQVHVLKIYVNMPKAGAEAPVLYIGDEKIDEYGSFPEGIFVKVYSAKQLQSWQGKPLRILYRKEMIDLNTSIPAKPDRAPARLPRLNEVLQGSAAQN